MWSERAHRGSAFRAVHALGWFVGQYLTRTSCSSNTPMMGRGTFPSLPKPRCSFEVALRNPNDFDFNSEEALKAHLQTSLLHHLSHLAGPCSTQSQEPGALIPQNGLQSIKAKQQRTPNSHGDGHQFIFSKTFKENPLYKC